MGGYGGLIAQNMTNTGQEDLARNRMLQDEQRRTKLGLAVQAYQDAPDQAGQETALNAIKGLYPDASHGPAFLADLFHIHHKNVSNAQQSQPSTDDLGGMVPPGPAPSAIPQPVAQVAQAPTAADAFNAITKIPNQTQTARETATAASERLGANQQALQKLRNEGMVAAAKARGANARPVHIGDTTPNDAIANMHNLGYEYLDENQQPITEGQLREAPPYMKLVEFRQGPQSFYKLVDQNTKMWNIGGQDYQAGTLGKQSPETLQPLGQATSTLPKFHTVPGMNPGEQIKLSSGTAATPGITAPTAQPAVNPPGTTPTLQQRVPVSSTTPQVPNPGARPPGTQPQGGAVKNKAAQPATSNPELGPAPPAFQRGTILAQGRSAQPVVSAMTTVAANVFGANGKPPIWNNAWMFDKPDISAALNRALTLNALTIPGTREDPSFFQTLATGLGVTGFSQQQIYDANTRAQQELLRVGGPEAMDMLARMAAMQEDLSALRTATRGSAAQGSIQTLVRAAPVYNVSSSQSFRDRLGATLTTAAASLHGYPAINPEFINWFNKGAGLAEKAPASGPKSAKTPSGPQQGQHTFALDAQGNRHPVKNPNAALPAGWKWGD